MDDSPTKKSYIDIDKLVARTGWSRATIWRLKRDRKIPFFQPAGKGGRVTFPEDAIERVLESQTPDSVISKGNSAKRLPGPQPDWMASPSLDQ